MYNPLLQLVDYLRLREAVKKADKAYLQHGYRYYVMPSESGRLIVMDKRNFRILKRKHYINHRVTVRDIVSESFYFTPYRNGTGYLDEKGRKIKTGQYFSWCRYIREKRKKEKKEKKE